jgi:serine/threonine protein phosphatase PrpC
MQRRTPARDHMELVGSKENAGVSDRGIKHYRNEDFLATSFSDGLLVAVICDGVSTSQNPDKASQGAATAALEVLASQTPSTDDSTTVMKAAITQAQLAVKNVPGEETEDLSRPASTIVAASLSGAGSNREVIIGWLGDSRAYFVPSADGAEARLLTRDHSWVNKVVDEGKMTYAEALRCKNAHSITKTLGGDPFEPDTDFDEPSIIQLRLQEPGWLLLCSDGLWNYADNPAILAALIRNAPTGLDALGLSQFLVAWVCQQGGRDNVTVFLAAI